MPIRPNPMFNVLRPKRFWHKVLVIAGMAIQTPRAIALPITTVALLLSLASLACESQETAGQAELDALSKLADMTTVTDLTAVGKEPDDPYYIEPMVRARIAEYVAAQAEAAKTGIPATVPDTVPIGISSKRLDGDWSAGRDALHQFLLDNGASYFDEGRGGADIYVPFTLFPRLVEHPQFSRAQLAFKEDEDYLQPKLDRPLNNVVAALNGGASPEQAASHVVYRHKDKVFLYIATDHSDASWEAVRRFFADNDVYVPGTGPAGFGALMSPSLIVPFSQIPEVIGLETIPTNDWNPEYRDWLVWHLLPPDQRAKDEPPLPR